MYYYSQAISEFTKKLYRLANGILLTEMGLKTYRTRFEINRYRYPLSFVTFEKNKTLGYFDAEYLQIGIHRHFLFTNDDELLLNVLRHELVHYIAYIQYGSDIDAHGCEFKQLCKNYGFSDEVASATYDDYQQDLVIGKKHPKADLLEKVKKLFRLSESSNQHEAQLALEKANRLLKLNSLNSPTLDEEIEYQIKIVHSGKRVNAKYQAVAEILHQFMVKAIFNHSQSGGYRLEIFGRPEHIEFAEYVFHYLDQEIEHLWKLTKKEYELKGMRAKNSFIWGLAEGFIETLKNNDSAEPESRELIRIESEVTTAFHEFYRSKRSSQVSSKMDSSSQSLGKKAGANINIKQPLNSNKTFLLN